MDGQPRLSVSGLNLNICGSNFNVHGYKICKNISFQLFVAFSVSFAVKKKEKKKKTILQSTIRCGFSHLLPYGSSQLELMPWSLSLILQLYQPLERNVGQVFLAANTANITIGAGLPSMVPGMDEKLLKTNFALDKAHKDNDPSSPWIQLIV